jgi:hypothetical protein
VYGGNRLNIRRYSIGPARDSLPSGHNDCVTGGRPRYQHPDNVRQLPADGDNEDQGYPGWQQLIGGSQRTGTVQARKIRPFRFGGHAESGFILVLIRLR